MLISPVIFITLLILGTTLTYLAAVRWPRAVYPTGLTTVGIALILWLALARQLPQYFPVSAGIENLFAPPWLWQLNEANWLLSGVLLLLAFALLLFRAGQFSSPAESSSHFTWQLSHSEWQPVLILSLVVATLSTIWAAALATLMMSWTLLAVFWALYLLTTSDQTTDPSYVTKRLFWMLAPLLFAGITAAVKPVGSDILDMSSWPPAAIVAISLTAMSQMGVMPFIGWRPQTTRWLPVDGPILYLIPPLAGAGLLLRLAAAVNFAPGLILILTLFALIGILSGIRRAWTDLREAGRLPANLALSLSSLSFLAAIWARSEALLAGVHLLVFSLTILFLLESLPISRLYWWRAIAPATAILALAGLPLTAGFITVASVYTVWLNNSLWVLVIALVLLLLPLLSAVIIFVRDHIARDNIAPNQQNSSPVSEIAVLLPAAGLIMLGGLPVSDIPLTAWLALILTAAGALLLVRYVGEVQEVISIADAALSPDRPPLDRFGSMTQKIVSQVVFSLSEAALILEGDRGLLWLAAFLAVLLFAISI